MPIDFDQIAPAAKAHYIEIGRSYGSEATLAQADATLEDYERSVEEGITKGLY